MQATKITEDTVEKKENYEFQGTEEPKELKWLGETSSFPEQGKLVVYLSTEIELDELILVPEMLRYANEPYSNLVELLKPSFEFFISDEEAVQSVDFDNLNRQELLESLEELKTEASEKGWDGYNADPMNENSYEQAKKFILLLPSNIKMPDITIDPDGEVSFNWIKNPQNIFTVSISPEGLISYAGLFNGNTSYGKEKILDEIPETVIKNIKRVFP